MGKIHEKCKGCLKVNMAGECMAFIDIEYQHKRKGGCYGRVEKAEDMAKMYEDLASKANDIHTKIKYKREAQRWRKHHGQA